VTLLEPLRVAERFHGHLGWLAALALLHPAILLRHPRRRADLAVFLSTALVTVTAAMGAALYGPYRHLLRHLIFAGAPAMGYLFERKEHLGFGAVLMAWTGLAAYSGSRWAQGDERAWLHRASHWAFVVAAVFAIATALFGTLVASYRSF